MHFLVVQVQLENTQLFVATEEEAGVAILAFWDSPYGGHAERGGWVTIGSSQASGPANTDRLPLLLQIRIFF